MVNSIYPTEQDYITFLGFLLVGGVIVVLFYGMAILMFGTAGDSLARGSFPNSVRSIADFARGRFFTPELAAGSLRGYAFAFILLGGLVLFYLIGRNFFGIWLPAEGSYTNMLSLALPFLYPLVISTTAAVSEEFIFRLFAISFLKRYIRFTFLALLIPAMIWAFGHSSYAVFPVYVRGIELTIGGLAFGYMFIRYDLWTVVVAHYAIDALLIGLPLLSSDSLYFQVSGYVVLLLALLPALPALFVWRRRQAATAT